MANMQNLIDTHIENQLDLTDVLTPLKTDRWITGTQWGAITERLIPVLPARVIIMMRTKKGVIVGYASHAAGVLTFTLDHRAKDK
jgi:hypothetical protein